MLAGAYAVHELLPNGDEASCSCNEEELHPNEAVGRNLKTSQEGVWEEILAEGGGRGRGWAVRAGPIEHRGELLQDRTDLSSRCRLYTSRADTEVTFGYGDANTNPSIQRNRSSLARPTSQAASFPPVAPYLSADTRTLQATFRPDNLPASTLWRQATQACHLRRLQRRYQEPSLPSDVRGRESAGP
jgi:hypothetical protein